MDELEVSPRPLTLGDKTAGVTQIALSSDDPGDCFGLHALNVVNDGTASLVISSIENFDPDGDADRIYVVKTLPHSIASGTVNKIVIQDTTDFIIENIHGGTGDNECSDMSLELKGSSHFIPTDNPLLASRCSNGGEDKRVLIIDFAAARELAYENVTDSYSTGMDDSDSIGIYDDEDFIDSKSLSLSEITAQKEQRNTWLSAGLMGASTFFSSAAVATQNLLAAATPPAAIGMDSPVHVINCNTPTPTPAPAEGEGNFPVVLTGALVISSLLVVGGLFAYVAHKCKSHSGEFDPENGKVTEQTHLINP